MYDYLIFDTVNIGYMVFNNSQNHSQDEMKQSVIKMSNKRIYKLFIREYLETIEFLKKKFLKENGELIFLYDNYHSRAELKQIPQPLKESDSRKKYNAEYKAQRKSARAEFYNTLETLRYYFLIGDSNIHTVRIPRLEADDLVKPCLSSLRRKKPNSKVLLATNDSDWCRYLDADTQYLPEIYKEPIGREKFIERWGYTPTEESVVLYKILYGDDADNIKAVFPEFDSKLKKQIMDTFSSVEDFMYEAKNVPELKPYISLITDKEKEKNIKVAYQLISAIPVSEAHFRQVFTTGRKSVIMKKQLTMIIFDQQEEPVTKFTFGGIVPRFTPSGK